MSSVLYSLKRNLKEYASTISEAINVDVEIIDSNLIRIAGTGSKQCLTDIYMEEEGHICKYVMETKQKIIIEKPGLHRICLENCIHKKNCNMTFVISDPIIFEDKAIGAINLVCFTKEQKLRVKNNLNILSKFCTKTSQLVASKAGHLKLEKDKVNLLNRFTKVLNIVEDNIILLNEDKKILYTNQKAEEILGYSKDDMKDKFFGDIFYFNHEITGDENFLSTEKVYYFEKNKKTKKVFGKMNVIDEESNYLFSFCDKVGKITSMRKKDKRKRSSYKFIGENKEIVKLKNRIKKYSKSNSFVLIQGETGTGKEIVAKTLHYESSRKENSFVVVNCGAIPDNLLESELFGYAKGSFTGANKDGKVGKFEIANNGTIFLDEIGDMPMQLQVKLLRVLQENSIQKIGSSENIPLNIRVISATNKDLTKLIKEGTFREDLYYRLNIIPINIPPLRERIDDLNILVYYFIEKKCEELGIPCFTFDKEAIDYLKGYNWPGNIRELENLIEFIANTIDDSEKTVKKEIIKEKIIYNSKDKITSSFQEYDNKNFDSFTPRTYSNEEKLKIIRLLEYYGDDVEGKKEVARELGVSLSTLYRKINENNIKRGYI